jgi:predicted protein tyrosine phosphatase
MDLYSDKIYLIWAYNNAYADNLYKDFLNAFGLHDSSPDTEIAKCEIKIFLCYRILNAINKNNQNDEVLFEIKGGFIRSLAHNYKDFFDNENLENIIEQKILAYDVMANYSGAKIEEGFLENLTKSCGKYLSLDYPLLSNKQFIDKAHQSSFIESTDSVIAFINSMVRTLSSGTSNFLTLSKEEIQRRISGGLKKEAESPTTPSGCYIATMVYGSYEAEEVLILRNFRDTVLEKTILGRLFIRSYYYLSPKLVLLLEDKTKINLILRKILDKLVSLVNNKRS